MNRKCPYTTASVCKEAWMRERWSNSVGKRESGYWSMPLILLLRNCIATWLQWGNVCKSL